MNWDKKFGIGHILAAIFILLLIVAIAGIGWLFEKVSYISWGLMALSVGFVLLWNWGMYEETGKVGKDKFAFLVSTIAGMMMALICDIMAFSGIKTLASIKANSSGLIDWMFASLGGLFEGAFVLLFLCGILAVSMKLTEVVYNVEDGQRIRCVIIKLVVTVLLCIVVKFAIESFFDICQIGYGMLYEGTFMDPIYMAIPDLSALFDQLLQKLVNEYSTTLEYSLRLRGAL